MLIMCTDTTCEFCDGMDCNNPEDHIHIEAEKVLWTGIDETKPVCKSHKSKIEDE